MIPDLIILALFLWLVGLPILALVWAYLKSWRVERYEAWVDPARTAGGIAGKRSGR